jgi:carboxyl-terminal processing protease
MFAVVAAALIGSSYNVNSVARERENPPVAKMESGRRIDRMIIRTIAQLMDQQHLSKLDLDDEISRRAFVNFLDSIDPLKLYFLQEDIDAFKSDETNLDDFARNGSMDFAIRVFKVFMTRVEERVAMAHELIDQEHDFTVDEEIAVDPDAISYPKDDAEARDRMRRQIKYSLLVLESDKLRAEKEEQQQPEDSEESNNDEGSDESDEAESIVDDDPRERLHRRYRNVEKRWQQTDADDLLEIYVSALTTSFDPHTTYMSPNTLENFRIVMSLNLEGIGAQLTSEDGYTKLTSIVPGGAADKDGRLKPGDRIIAVGQDEDGAMQDVIDMKLDDVVHLIRGPAGTVVRLGVLPAAGGESTVIKITRAKISLDDSAARGEVVEFGTQPNGDPFNVGYIDLPSFYRDMEADRNSADGFRSTTRDVSKILADFRDQDVSAVVLDLSRNGGGSLTEAISLTGLFIDSGPVVQVKDPSGQVQVYDDEDRGVAWDGPLVVMTSKGSASASEILAGAIQDYRRGLIVGDPATHGKGTVQSLIDIGQQLFGGAGEMGALKLTIQQFYLPGGKSTQRQGVMADIVLPAITAAFDNSESDLDYALPNDTIEEAEHLDYHLVNSTLLSKLRSASIDRIREDQKFDRLLDRIELFKEQKNQKFVSLNRDKFLQRREEMDARREEQEQILDSQISKDDVFKMDHYSREVLSITKDYVEQLDKLDLAQAG